MRYKQGTTTIAEQDAAATKKDLKGRHRVLFSKKMTPKKISLFALSMLVLIGGGYGCYKLFFYEEPVQIVTGTTTRDSITTVISGTAVTSPTSFQMLTVPVDGTVKEVNVSQGDTVAVGAPLYTIDSESIETDIANLEASVADYESQLKDLVENVNNLTVSAPFAGKVTGITVEDGDEVSANTTIATLVNDSQMILELYFSVAYWDDITIGMSANVSIAQYMTELEGTVLSTKKVSYITSEGTECFKVTIAIDNPGSLTEGLEATATLSSSGVELSPADSGTLACSKTKKITAGASGTISLTNLEDSLKVSSGELLAVIDNDDYSDQISTLEKKIESANLSLADYNETLSDCVATAEVVGTVIFVRIEAGDEVSAGASSMAIYNTDAMEIEANINEVQNEYITLGMDVTITKSGASVDEQFTGKVTAVSLEGTSSNGVAYFPTTISIDSKGELSAGVYVSYSITAAQAADVILAPVAAVKQTTEGTCLFIQADSRPDNAVDLGEGVEVPEGYYAVPVKTGLTSNNLVEITSGVEEGVTVFEQYVVTSSVSGSDKTSETSDDAVFQPGSMPNGSFPGGNGGSGGSGASGGFAGGPMGG